MFHHLSYPQANSCLVAQLLMAILLFVGMQSSVAAQILYQSPHGSHQILLFEATGDQLEKNEEMKARYDEKIQPLQNQLDKLEEQIKRVRQDHAAELHQLLTPAQWKFINEERLATTRERVEENAAFLQDFASFCASIAKAEELTIYEGLPRATPEEIKAIKDKDKTVQFDGFDFYAPPLVGRPGTQEELRELLTDHQRFKPHVGKFCGGFHPDIAVQYEVAGQQYLALICLGCWELKVTGPRLEYLFDFDEHNHEALVQIANSVFTHRKLDKRGL